jgi:hypothetical protein
MANAAFGFRPVRMIDGSPFNAAQRLMFVSASDSVNLFPGDLVTAGTQTYTNNPRNLPTVTQSAASQSNTLGVVISVDPIIAYQGSNVGLENLYRLYRPASTAGYVLVCTDSRVVYELALDGAASALSASEINQGYNIDITVGTGSTATGVSAMQGASAGIATTSTFPCRILGFSQRTDNTPGLLSSVIEVVLQTIQPTRS